LSNSNIDAVKSLSVIRGGIIESSLLVNDSINGNSGLTSLSITNDKLSLASSNRTYILIFINSKDLISFYIIIYLD
jgi:hypothetical protein